MFSIVATVTTAIPLLAVISYLLKEPFVYIIALPVFVIYFIVAERILESIAGVAVRLLEIGDRLLNFVEKFDKDDIYEKENAEDPLDFPDEHLLYVWGLASSIQSEMSSSRRLNTYIIVVDDGFPVEMYPYPNESEVIDLDELSSSNVTSLKVEVKNERSLLIYIPLEHFEILGKACERGEGEIIDIKTKEEAVALYNLAKSIASLYETQNDILLSYLAYKIILKLKSKGIVNIDDKMLEELPLGDANIRTLIKSQVNEELGFLKKV